MSEPFDLFIPVALKDLPRLPWVIESAHRYIEGWDELHICTADPLLPSGGCWMTLFAEATDKPIKLWSDAEVLPWKGQSPYRPNWVHQQALKLWQTVTPHDWYVTLDADVIINRTLRFWQNDRPVWYIGHDQNHEPYYRFNEKVLGYRRRLPHTCLADMNFFCRTYTYELLERHKAAFMHAHEFIDAECHPSEADLYMNYMATEHTGLYELRRLRTAWQGVTIGPDDDPAETYNMIEKVEWLRNSHYDTFAFHTYLEGDA